MADFIATQKSYLEAKLAFEAATDENYLLRQRIAILEKEISLLLRSEFLTALPANHPKNAERTKVLNQLNASDTKLKNSQTTFEAARKEFDLLGFANTTIANLDDSVPILLMPLRVQTRFQTIKHIARNIPENLLVDVSKLGGLRNNFQRLFRRLQPITDPLAKSQAHLLSNNSDAGANMLIEQLHPVFGQRQSAERWLKVEDSYELCVRIFPDDIFLQSHEHAVTEPEIAHAKIFWQSMWSAERKFRQSERSAESIKIRNDQQLAAWKELRFTCLAHRAAWIAYRLRPADYPDNFPVTLADIPDNSFPPVPIKAESWTVPPQTNLLPEHFIVKIFFNNSALPPKEVNGSPIPDYIQLGFDPEEKDEDAFAEKNRTLDLPKAIRWITDLSEAERCGMAVRIPLSKAEFDSKISRLVVLGVKIGAGAAEGGRLMTKLFENHQYKSQPISILEQGTSTNNVVGQPTRFNRKGLTDEQSFFLSFPSAVVVDPASDGQRLSTALGLDSKTFLHVFNHNRRDCHDALTTNRALWPGTLGYYLDNMMRPSVTDNDISFVKSFFQNFVAGRGLLPVLGLGKQPYGIVPATVWSAWKPLTSASAEEVRLVKLLQKLDTEWNALTARVKTMKKVFANQNEATRKTDFRELLAFQPSSTRFFRRLVAGEYLLYNINQVAQTPGAEKVGIQTTPSEYVSRLESANGWNEAVKRNMRILGKFMDNENYKLTDAVVNEVQDLVVAANNNYLKILLNATLEQLKTFAFGDNFATLVSQKQNKLMFYLARFSILQSWVKAATDLLLKENLNISPLARLDFEMEYVDTRNIPSDEHLMLLFASGFTGDFKTRKNKWAFFEEGLPNGSRVDATIANMLSANSRDESAQSLKEVRAAFSELSSLPVQQMERLFSEHIDLCSFRLDAWLQGLALSRLSDLRKKPGFEKGLFVGAFGYLENIEPNNEAWVKVKTIENPQVVDVRQAGKKNVVIPVFDFTGLTPEQIAKVRSQVFVYLGSDPTTSLIEDPETKEIIQNPGIRTNREEGFVLTPSIEHAATAGILRAGYENNSKLHGPESKTLSVSIDSQRTGRAIDMLKAIRAGHSLNEQLGYFIERSMYNTASLAAHVPHLREAFPLHIERHEWDDDQQISEAEKISNLSLIADGLAIVNKFQTVGATPAVNPSWETKLAEVLKDDLAGQQAPFEKIVSSALDQFDAVGDLVFGESVFQMVKGSPERAAAALRMINEGSDITLPEVAQVNPETRLLTYRVGFVLNSAGPPPGWTGGTDRVSIFSRLSPDFDQWLAEQFPPPGKIFARVVAETGESIKISMASLGLRAIDFYYILKKSGYRPDESVLPWIVKEAARTMPALNNTIVVEVRYERDRSFALDELSLREILPLLQSVGLLVERSRPLRPSDFNVLSSQSQPVNTQYDSAALKATAGEFASSTEAGPIPTYVRNLTTAQNELEHNFPRGFGSPESDAAFVKLHRLIPRAYAVGIWDASPRCPEYCNEANARVLIDQALEIKEKLQAKLTRAAAVNTRIASAGPVGEQLFIELTEVAKILVGEDVLILPKFSLNNPAEISLTLNDNSLKNSLGEFGLEEWLQGLAMVRENMRSYQTVLNLREICDTPAKDRRLTILQLPHIPGQSNSWIGAKFPKDFTPPPNATSMAFEFSKTFDVRQPVTGILLDDWNEKVPLPTMTTGVSINYNQANSEAPQSMLLAVAPEITGAWSWDTLVNTVFETMTLAKKRAVDTELLQNTWLSQFLPAIVAPLDTKNNTPGLDFRVAGPPLPRRPVVDPDIGTHDPGDGGVFAP